MRVRASSRRTGTTVLAVVGDTLDEAAVCVRRLADAVNVAEFEAGADAPLDRAVAAWSGATAVHTPYFVHDADPLAAVADEWVRRFDAQGAVGALEVVIADTLARWRVGSIELPDYYLLLDPARWGPTRRHWYLGVLHAAAPARVVPVAGADDALDRLARLPTGRWWPDLDELLAGIEHVVPDRVGLDPAMSTGQPSEDSSARIA
jgi:hypothetical protein